MRRIREVTSAKVGGRSRTRDVIGEPFSASLTGERGSRENWRGEGKGSGNRASFFNPVRSKNAAFHAQNSLEFRVIQIECNYFIVFQIT